MVPPVGGASPFPAAEGRQPRVPGLGTPRPTPESEAKVNRFVAERIDAENMLDVQEGRIVILRLKQAPFRDQVADPSVAGVLNITETEYSITGLKSGTTALNFWFRDPEAPGGQSLLSYLVRVQDDPETTKRYEALLENLEREINRAFPNSAVRLMYVGTQVVVRGQAKDIEEGTQILRIVSQSIPGADMAEQQFALESFFVQGITEQGIEDAGGLSGVTRGQNQSGVNGANINRRIVNLLQIAGVHQVLLKVSVAEVNRSAIRSIGADLRIGGDSGVSFTSLLPLAQLGLPGAGGTFLVNRGDFDLAINALKTMNLARSLAEPNLVALNGQAATFDVTSSFPVPIVTANAAAVAQGVQFIPVGVQMQFTPTVTDGDRIRLNLVGNVSVRDDSQTVTIDGTNVPGTNERQFVTTVELREGQTLALAGLIQSNLGASSSRIPFLGDIPFVGRLFSSDTSSYDEQELIVLVTPYLVAPVGAEAPRPPVPGSDFFEPSDLEFFLRGSLAGCRAEDFRTPARTDIEKMKAFRRCEQEFIIGQPGHSTGRLCPAPVTPARPPLAPPQGVPELAPQPIAIPDTVQ